MICSLSENFWQYSFERQKLRNSIFDGPLIVNQIFHKLNMLLPNQILHILCIFIKPNVLHSWSLKESYCSISQKFYRSQFAVGGPRNMKLLADILFESSLQNTVLSSLLLFLFLLLSWSRRYSIKWNSDFDQQ